MGSTLDRLKEVQQKRRQIVKVGDVEVTVMPMTAAAGMQLAKRFDALFADGDVMADDPLLLEFYTELVALTVVEPDSNELALNSDEGRALFRSLTIRDQMELGAAAADASGIAHEVNDAKKN